jgi:DNA-binding transcriptional LysR family regulator
VEMLLSDTTTKPSGDIRISAPIGLGSVWMAQRIREFIDLYPEIRVELLLDDNQIDLAMRAGDVAIWTQEPEQADLIRRPLFNAKVRPVASAQYIRRFGTPNTLPDLDQGHRIISYSGLPSQHLPAISWLETAGRDGQEPRVPSLRVNSVVAIKTAVMTGVGIGMLPDYMFEGEGESEFVPVLTKTEDEQPSLPILFVYPEELKTSKKVQVLRDFLVAKARQWKE